MRLALAVEGYRRRRGGFPETLNAENLRLEAAVCRDPYSGRLFEYFSSAGEYVLRAAPFWERSEGGISFALQTPLAANLSPQRVRRFPFWLGEFPKIFGVKLETKMILIIDTGVSSG